MTKNLKVKFIDNTGADNLLTVGKVYCGKIENAQYDWEDLNFVELIDDTGRWQSFLQYRFEIIESH